MKILVNGTDNRIDELKAKLKLVPNLEINISDGQEDEDFKEYDAIFDLNLDDEPEQLELYAGLKNKAVFVSAVKTSLSEMIYLNDVAVKCHLFGMNCLPTFIDRSKWEISLYRRFEHEKLQTLMQALQTDFEIVEDRVGMVTPRVLFMIINEACYTLQEGTASIEAIDLGMKLGTNYPKGPFEWADSIGITEVFETLAALYQDTGDERYKICPLLKTRYLRNQPFIKG
jgi:3-hydroxybutyryl-CoA dehydrogenase